MRRLRISAGMTLYVLSVAFVVAVAPWMATVLIAAAVIAVLVMGALDHLLAPRDATGNPAPAARSACPVCGAPPGERCDGGLHG